MMKRIKPQTGKISPGKNFKAHPNSGEIVEEINYPIFCFKHLHRDYNIEKCEPGEKQSLLERIVKLSSMTWLQIEQTNRHGLGSEKIAINAIRPACPSFITADVKFLLALRFQNNKPFIGFKNGYIFHVIFIDRAFNVYNHG